jgi:hypothetical protein
MIMWKVMLKEAGIWDSIGARIGNDFANVCCKLCSLALFGLGVVICISCAHRRQDRFMKEGRSVLCGIGDRCITTRSYR